VWVLVGIAGIFSVSQAAVFGVGAYIVAYFLINGLLSFLPALAIAAFCCIALNILVTLPALRVAGDYFVVTSFGIQRLATAVFTNWTDGTGGANGLPGIPPPDLAGKALETGSSVAALCVGGMVCILAGVALVWWREREAPVIGEAAEIGEIERFDRAAGYYDRTRAIPELLMERLIPLLAAELPREGLCLEIGVGTGRIALPLSRAGVHLVGVDISREMLRRLIANANGTPSPVLQADATRLPFRDGAFGAALAVHVLHLIPAWKDAVAEVVRTVRPGGVLIASRGVRDDEDWSGRVRRRFFHEAGDPAWPPGLGELAALDAHLVPRGAAVHELPALTVTVESSVDELLGNLEAGYLSACWSLDEPTRTGAARRVREWARRELGDLAAPRPVREGSVWRMYRLAE